jgi:hypothetical protein
MLVTSITPALARGGWYGGGGLGWGGGWGGGRHHRGDNDTGEVLAGVLIGAAVVGILASASKNKRARDTDQNGRNYPQDSRDNPNDRRDDRARGNINTENAAVDACAQAAEDRSGNAGSVRDITSVSPSSDGWNVEGVVERRDGWRDRTTERHKFTCSVRYGMVDSVYVEDAKVAYAQ